LWSKQTEASGNIGADFAAQAEPDSHTCSSRRLGRSPSTRASIGFLPTLKICPVTVLAAVTNLIIVRPGIEVNQVMELIALPSRIPARSPRSQGRVDHGSHRRRVHDHDGVRAVHVPYRGENQVINAMLGGRRCLFGNVAPVLPITATATQVLAVAGVKRAASIPDVPTAAGAGLPGFVSTSGSRWRGTKCRRLAWARRDFADVLSMRTLQTKYRSIARNLATASRNRRIRAETARWRGHRKEQYRDRVGLTPGTSDLRFGPTPMEQLDLRLYAIVIQKAPAATVWSISPAAYSARGDLGHKCATR
jgi:tripartite-type tricarboxylate transporter receptor subunit TctC